MKGLSCGFIALCFRKVLEAPLVLPRLLRMSRGASVSLGLWCYFGNYGMCKTQRGRKKKKKEQKLCAWE